jgi:hypothetical protein
MPLAIKAVAVDYDEGDKDGDKGECIIRPIFFQRFDHFFIPETRNLQSAIRNQIIPQPAA